ncbi:MAG: SDR family oxidoreductase [Phycisphaerae bacterium]
MDFSAYNNLPVLVTGGAGFIGSHLVRGLLEAGAKVRVLDNLSQGSKTNLREVESRIEFVLGDITDHTSCRQAVRGREIVFHLAALGSVPGSVADPIGYNAVNIGGTLNVLESARLEKVRRVVYSASSAAYGDSPTLPKRETMKPAPKSPYAVGKYTGELYAAVYAKVYGLSTISLRYFNVFGPRQNPRSAYAAVIPAFITAVLENRRPQIYGDGGQTRDFCHVSNVVYANMLAGICLQPPAGEVVNIACAENISLNALLERIIKLVGQSAAPEYLPPRAGDVRDSLADISLARAVIGYEPILYFNQGLEQTVPWYRDAAAKMQPPART